MICEHDIVEITTVGDTFHRGLCIKCGTRFVGPPVVASKWLEGGPWRTYEAYDKTQSATSGTETSEDKT